MALPFLTTKTHRVDQRGRFGIGLKTLKRIADAITIHSAPYHFSGDQLSLKRVEQEPGQPSFYCPTRDTLLVLDLRENFAEKEFRSWFEAWEEDGLIFLESVSRFRWCSVKGEVFLDRAVEKGGWEPAAFDPLHEAILAIRHRHLRGRDREWRVWNATVSVPADLKPAHKARSETTQISVAVPEQPSRGSLYIGVKTRWPTPWRPCSVRRASCLPRSGLSPRAPSPGSSSASPPHGSVARDPRPLPKPRPSGKSATTRAALPGQRVCNVNGEKEAVQGTG